VVNCIDARAGPGAGAFQPASDGDATTIGAVTGRELTAGGTCLFDTYNSGVGRARTKQRPPQTSARCRTFCALWSVRVPPGTPHVYHAAATGTSRGVFALTLFM
jgi:hypothetical protein